MRVWKYAVFGLVILLAIVAPATAITLTLENVYETILKPAPVPASSIEVVYPDGNETIVVVYRDNTKLHGLDVNANATVKMSRDRGKTWTYVATIDEPDFDESRTGDCLIKILCYISLVTDATATILQEHTFTSSCGTDIHLQLRNLMSTTTHF